MIDAPPPQLWLPPKPAIIRPGPRMELVDFRSTFPGPMFVPRASNFATRSNRGITAGSVSGTNFTFSSVDLGTADGTSLVAVIAYVWSTGNDVTISSVSIDGTNGTIHIQAQGKDGAGSRTARIGIASRATSNATGTIIVNNSASNLGAAIAVYRLTKLTSATADATASAISATNGTAGSPISSSLNITDHGLLLLGVCSTDGAPSSVTGATQDGSTTLFGSGSTGRAWAGSNQNLAVQVGRSVSASFSPVRTSSLAACTWH